MILVLVGGVILSAPVVQASTRISARLKRVQGHVSRVNGDRGTRQSEYDYDRRRFPKNRAVLFAHRDVSLLSLPLEVEA